MAKSIKQLQNEIITEGFIDSLAKDRTNYQDLNQYPVLKKMILLASEEFIKTAVEELERQGKVNTGGLADDISSTDILESRSGYEVELGYDASSPSAKYYDYVNKGVRGWGSGSPNSEYDFTKSNPHPKMVSAIQLWMDQRGMKGRNEMRSGLNANQQKNKSLASLADQKKSLAYVIARSIKRKGIAYSGFFDKAVQAQFGDAFSNAVASAVASDLRVYIRKLDSLINKEQNNQN